MFDACYCPFTLVTPLAQECQKKRKCKVRQKTACTMILITPYTSHHTTNTSNLTSHSSHLTPHTSHTMNPGRKTMQHCRPPLPPSCHRCPPVNLASLYVKLPSYYTIYAETHVMFSRLLCMLQRRDDMRRASNPAFHRDVGGHHQQCWKSRCEGAT
jgi:hypothetical protein